MSDKMAKVLYVDDEEINLLHAFKNLIVNLCLLNTLRNPFQKIGRAHV